MHAYNIETIAPHALLTYLYLKRRCFITSYVQPVMQQYESKAVKKTFAIKVAATYQMEAITCLTQNRHFSWWTKMNGTQRRAGVSPWKMHCMYSGMAKGTSRAEATLNSEKIKSVALAIVELRESEGIRQAVSQ